MISGKQIKLARTSLDWTQDCLAEKTGLSSTTIYNLERGEISPRPASEISLRVVFEEAGIEFIEQDGIRHRSKDVTVYKGSGSTERFFNHLLETIKTGDKDITGIFQTPKLFMQCCNIVRGNVDHFRKLTASASVKCLLPSELPVSPSIPPFHFRIACENYIGTESCFTYGNQHALILPDGSSTFCFIVINSYSFALNKRSYFMKLWDKAKPFTTADTPLEHGTNIAMAAYA